MSDTRKPAGPERTPERAEAMLEEALGLARAEAARPAPEAFLARVLADAAREAPPAPAQARAAPPRLGRLAAALAALGGWPALGGLATAGVAGLWLGLSPPAAVEDLGGWLGAGDASAGLLLPDDYFSDAFEG
ncbi:MAG: dihydroorotate dehydrogenase [Paracoccaceae bacterium]|nr:dihydroorotate dehydrogenase [Paracoccaceae bacterium]